MFGARRGLTYSVWLTPPEIGELEHCSPSGMLETEDQERLPLRLTLMPDHPDGPNCEVETSDTGVHIRVLPLYLKDLVKDGQTTVVTDNMELVHFHDVSRSGPEVSANSLRRKV